MKELLLEECECRSMKKNNLFSFAKFSASLIKAKHIGCLTGSGVL